MATLTIKRTTAPRRVTARQKTTPFRVADSLLAKTPPDADGNIPIPDSGVDEYLTVKLSRWTCLHPKGGLLVATRQRIAGRDGSPYAHGAGVAEDRLSMAWKKGSLAATARRLLQEADPEALRGDPRLAEWREANSVLWGPPGAVPGALEESLDADVVAGYIGRLRAVASDRYEGDRTSEKMGPRRDALHMDMSITLIAIGAGVDLCRLDCGSYLVVRWDGDQPRARTYATMAEALARYQGRPVARVPASLRSEVA